MGAGAAAALGPGNVPAVSLAHGLTIMAFVAAFGDLSGGHINPAVTVGLAVAREFPTRRVILYRGRQALRSGIAAGLGLLAVFGSPVNDLGATVIDMQRITATGGFMLESIWDLSSGNHRAEQCGARQCWAARSLGHWHDGDRMHPDLWRADRWHVNPARTIGPAVAAGVYDGIAVYLVAQLVGGSLAGMLYPRILDEAARHRTARDRRRAGGVRTGGRPSCLQRRCSQLIAT